MNIVSTSTATFVPRHRRTSTHKDLFDPSVFILTCTSDDSHRTKRSRLISTIRRNASPLRSAKRVKKFISSHLPLEKYGTRIKFYSLAGGPNPKLKIIFICLVWYFFSFISGDLSKKILSRFKHPVALTELQFFVSATLCLAFASTANFLKRPTWCDTRLAAAFHDGFPKGTLPPYLDGDFNRSVLKTFLAPTRHILTIAFPLGIFQFVGHLTSHKATSIIPISLVHSIKALSPIVTVAYHSKFKGKKYSAVAYYTLGILMSGVAITCWSSHKSSRNGGATTAITPGSRETVATSTFLAGMAFAFISMVIFVTQNIIAKDVLTTEVNTTKGGEQLGGGQEEEQQQQQQQRYQSILPLTQKGRPVGTVVSGYPSIQSQQLNFYTPHQNTPKIDKLTLLFYCSCFGFLLTLSPFLTGEFLVNETSIVNELTWGIIMLILTHGLVHFVQAMLAFQLIGMMSGVNYSIASIMKRVVIIGAAVVTESGMNGVQLLGLGLTVLGLYGYDRCGCKVKRR